MKTTPKQFVKYVYPDANVVHGSGANFTVMNAKKYDLQYSIGWSTSPQKAWKSAADKILEIK